MNTLELIIISSIFGGSVLFIAFIGLLKKVLGFFFSPFYYPKFREPPQTVITNEDNKQRVFYTIICLSFVILWMIYLA